ncbi:DUF397 domain-containing protein [Streptomyces violaceoruber]|nr:DUF397 domain-containing protein [Streptomyces violaceoruber]
MSFTAWRKSSFSGDQGACVEVALLQDLRVALRDSNRPGAGTISFTASSIDAWLKRVRAGDFDALGSQD